MIAGLPWTSWILLLAAIGIGPLLALANVVCFGRASKRSASAAEKGKDIH